MRQNTQLAWEILEAEEEEWAEVTMAPAADEPRPARRQRYAAAFGVVVLLMALSGIAGYRLVQEAEAGIAATEHHIGTLVEVETIRQQKGAATGEIAADVRSVVVKGSAAMVRVVVTETSSLGHEPVPCGDPLLPPVPGRLAAHGTGPCLLGRQGCARYAHPAF